MSAEDADIVTGCSDYDDTVWEITVPTNVWEKAWDWIS